MAGLVWKDIIYIKKMWKTMLFSVLFFIIFSFSKNDTFSSTAIIAIMVGSNFSMIPFNYDNYSKWNEYQYAFPISRKTAVFSRYLFGAIVFGCCILIYVLIMLFQLFIINEIPEKEYLLLQIGVVCFVPVMQSVSFPLIYHCGVEQARLYLIAIFALIAMLVIGCSSVIGNIFCESNTIIIIAAMIMIPILLYMISLKLSIKIEQKKIL